MSSAVHYFPETDRPWVEEKPAAITPITEITLPIKKTAQTSVCCSAICYFPELDENFAVITDPWLTETDHADISSQAIQSIRHNIARELVIHEAYTEAIASLEDLSEDQAKLASLVETIITETVTATVKEIRANPQTIQLDYPKSSWFPLISNPKLSASPQSNHSAPAAAPAKPSYEKERQQKLIKIGQLLKRTRTKQAISRNQLNHTTHVLTHHIEAIEEGKLDQLPEDLYVRGFIRHLGNALKLDGKALADTLPTQNNQAQKPVTTTFFNQIWTSEATRYLGYGTLIAGAISGLSWSLQQSHSQSTPLQLNPQPPSTVAQQNDARPDTQMVRNSVKLAPPEIMVTGNR